MPRGTNNFKGAGPGRPPGLPNKINRDLVATLDAMGCDPAIGLATIAMDTKVKMDIRERAYGNLMKYVYPTKKAVEISQDKPHQLVFTWAGDLQDNGGPKRDQNDTEAPPE